MRLAGAIAAALFVTACAAGTAVPAQTAPGPATPAPTSQTAAATPPATVAPIQSPAPGRGVITGTVKDASTGDPVADVDVVVYDANSCCASVTQARTDASGRYSLSLPTGHFRLAFFPRSSALAPEWWPRSITYRGASGLQLSNERPTLIGLDANLARSVIIRGGVSHVTAGPPEGSFGVSAYAADPSQGGFARGVTGTADGSFALPLQPGTYRLRFTRLPLGRDVWWKRDAVNGAPSYAEADGITVTALEVSGISLRYDPSR